MKTLSLKIQHIEESQTLAFTRIVEKMKAAGIDVVSLNAGEPDFPTPPHVKMAAIQAIEENFTHYTANQGIPKLIAAIISKFAVDNDLHFEPSQILVSTGTKQAIFNALQAICNPGDEVVIPAPYWVSYPEMVKLADARPVIVPTTLESGFKMTPLQLRKAINTKTKALLLNSPSNPTGSMYSQGELEEFADIVEETGIFVISDEIYEKIVYDGPKHFSIGNIKQIRDQVITVNGVSKAYAMTGWRIGYLGASNQVAAAAAKVQSQVTSNANSIAQRAATVALSAPSNDVDTMVTEFKRRRDFLMGECAKIPGIEISKPKGAFYFFPSMKAFIGKRIDGERIKDDEDLCRFFLNDQQLVMVPGSAFGAKDHVRISFASSMKELEKAVQRLKEGCRKLHEGF